jgi:hypothetical protein
VDGFTRAEAQKRIRDWARRESNIILTRHACDRMVERGITELDMKRVLRRGCLDGGVVQTDQGEWKCKMTLRIRGEREIGVVVLILRNTGVLLVKTVELEGCQ